MTSSRRKYLGGGLKEERHSRNCRRIGRAQFGQFPSYSIRLVSRRMEGLVADKMPGRKGEISLFPFSSNTKKQFLCQSSRPTRSVLPPGAFAGDKDLIWIRRAKQYVRGDSQSFLALGRNFSRQKRWMQVSVISGEK